ncbi:flagellar protein export ATPase FliI [Candidatus Saccharibacteria bacterium]|nr:flagellar protein export ATPase FliI [Candidatus Saccharibacteria bacterium]NIV73020.1 flagellar protein export ATPase FliI [Calditrichia bacterium]NIW80652.1 flagellar protein export ATPase FliI [Calditrichia bacterium]
MLFQGKIEYLKNTIDDLEGIRGYGKILQVIGLLIESSGPSVAVGDVCKVYPKQNRHPYLAEVVGFREDRVLSMPLGDMYGIAPGSDIVALGEQFSILVSDDMLGRVLNGLGEPFDNCGMISGGITQSVYQNPPHPLQRHRITEPVSTGIRTIDGLLTLGKGQRVGIFSGSGVGKSTLLGMIAQNTNADVNVIGLVGERGREVRDFIEKELGESGLKRSVVVVATSDQPALVRVKSALVATTIAEYFRDQGLDVMLMMDSLTRVATALREIGLAIGEPPTTRGYTPSVFAFFPRLLERAGTAATGSITGMYTVLVEGDDMNEPIADSARGILDGHIVLSRRLASAGHYPAIDVLESISRTMNEITTADHRECASKFLDILATYKEAEDLINIGAYVKGSNPKIDESLQKIDRINVFLRQGIEEKSDLKNSIAKMMDVIKN